MQSASISLLGSSKTTNKIRWHESILQQLTRIVHPNSSTLAHSVTPQASLLGYHDMDKSWLTDLGPVTCGSRQRPDRTKVLRTTKPDGLPLDTTDELLQPLGDQLNLILTQSKCQMTINFQGSWHCAICQYLLVREFENNEHNETAREHFETVNEKSSSEQFYSRTQCDSTSLPSRLP